MTPEEQQIVALGLTLTRVDGKVDTGFAEVKGSINLLHEKLNSVMEIKQTVATHEKQIQLWKGVGQTLAAIVAIISGIFASLYAKYRHWV